jgi:hypothetical protein
MRWLSSPRLKEIR